MAIKLVCPHCQVRRRHFSCDENLQIIGYLGVNHNMKKNSTLTEWQKKQATLLYHFASIDYLRGLKWHIDKLIDYAEKLLEKSRVEERDSIVRNVRWGERDTTENWANNAWALLADFRLSIVKDIADRASQTYAITGAYQCSRGMSEYSMQWATPQEQEIFNKAFDELYDYAHNIDQTMKKAERVSRWNDFNLTLAWQKHVDEFPMLPKFRVLNDVVGVSGQLPPRTGVYVSMDDPDAALQFAWTGPSGGELLDAAVFNPLGTAALMLIGRSRLWVDGQAMLDFVLSHPGNPELKADPFFEDSNDCRIGAKSGRTRCLYLPVFQLVLC